MSTDMVGLKLDRDRPLPLARQIQGQLERLIGERLLAPGVKLPATRELAKTLGVNRATVALAYDELVAAGWARAAPWMGGSLLAERRHHRRRRGTAPARAGAERRRHLLRRGHPRQWPL